MACTNVPCGCRIARERERIEDGEFFYYPHRIGKSTFHNSSEFFIILIV